MKMRTIIEAGRQASPLVNEGLAEMKSRLASSRQLVLDLASVKSETLRDAALSELLKSLDLISVGLDSTKETWDMFDSALSSYKYKFGRVKINVVRDLPGQQVLFDDPIDCASQTCGTENR